MVAACVSIVRTAMEHNPKNYDEAFICCSKDYREVKILHYDVNGWGMYSNGLPTANSCSPNLKSARNAMRYQDRY